MRRTLIAILGCGLLVALLGALLPTLLSSASGRAWLFERVSGSIPGRLSATGMDLNWGDGQRIESLQLADAQGSTVARIRRITADISLAQILSGDYATGRILIEGLEIDLVLDEEGRLNLAGAVAAPDEKRAKPVDLPALLREFVLELPPSLTADVELRDARVSLRGPGIETPLELTGVAGTLRLERAGAPIEFDLGGTLDGSKARLHARLDGFDPQGRLRASDAKLALTLEADLTETAQRLLGSSAQLSVDVRTSRTGAEFALNAETPRLTVSTPGRIELKADEAPRLQLTRGARANYSITPAMLRTLSASDAAVTLANEVELSLAIDSLDLAFDRSALAVEARAALTDGRVDVTVGGSAESLAWSGWSASIRKQAAGESAALALRGRVEQGEVDLAGKLRLPAEADLKASIQRFPLARIDRVAQSFTGKPGLLVDLLGPTLDVESRIEKQTGRDARIALRVDTRRLQLTAPLVVDVEQKTVRARGVELRYTVSPSLVPALDRDLPVSLDVESFAGALTRFDPARTSLRAKLAVGATRLGGSNPVEVRGATVEVDSESLAAGLRVRAECRLDEGRVYGAGDLAQLWSDTGEPQFAHARGKLELTIENLPVARFEPALGDLLNGRIGFDGGGENARLDLQLRSNRLDAKLPLLLASGRVRLREPGRIRCTLTPKSARRFLPAAYARLRQPVEASVSLQAIDLPADGSFAPGDARAQGSLTLGAVRLENVAKAGTVTLTEWKAEFDGPSLEEAEFAVEGNAEFSGIPLGGPLRIAAKGDGRAARLTATSERLTFALALLREDDGYRLGEPAKLDLEVRRELLRRLELPHDWLRSAVRVHAVVDSFDVPRNLDWTRGTASFRLDVPGARIRVDGRDVTLRELGVTGSIAQRIVANLKGKLGDGDVVVRAELAGRRDDAPLALDARLRGFPTGLLGNDATLHMGRTADLELKAELPDGWRGRRGTVSLTTKSPQLDLDVEFAGEQEWRLARPARARWTMTPAAFLALMPESKMRLEEPAEVRVDIAEMTLPPDRDSLAKGAIVANAQVPDLRLRAREGAVLRVRALNLQALARNPRDHVLVKLNGAIEGGTNPGRIHGTIRITDLDELADDRASSDVDLELEALPVRALDDLLALDGYLPAVLGESAGGTLRARLTHGNGPVDLALESGNLKATIAGSVTRSALLLRAPIEAKLTHSEAFADKVLPKLGPLFEGIVGTEVPISLVVPHRGFRVPRPFDFTRVDIPKVVLDVGKVTMENKTLVRLIKKLARSSLPDKTDAWFTPVEVSLQRGVVRYTRRLDLLLENRYHLSTWGSADLARNRIDMVLGVMPETLKEILRIQGVGKADTLRIAVTGALDKPRIELGRVVTDLALIRGKDDALRNLPDLARPFAEAALRKMLRKTLKGPPPLNATADPLPWVEPER